MPRLLFSAVQCLWAFPEMLHSEHWKPVLDNNVRDVHRGQAFLPPSENICSSRKAQQRSLLTTVCHGCLNITTQQDQLHAEFLHSKELKEGQRGRCWFAGFASNVYCTVRSATPEWLHREKIIRKQHGRQSFAKKGQMPCKF